MVAYKTEKQLNIEELKQEIEFCNFLDLETLKIYTQWKKESGKRTLYRRKTNKKNILTDIKNNNKKLDN